MFFDLYFSHDFDAGYIGLSMFARFPLSATRSNDRLMRLADWWPAALIGLLALMGSVPDGKAQTLLSLF